MKIRITKLPKAAKGGLSDYLSQSKDHKSAAGYGAKRIALAQKMGINNYTGTAEQNNEFLHRLQSNSSSVKSTTTPMKKNIITTTPSPVITKKVTSSFKKEVGMGPFATPYNGSKPFNTYQNTFSNTGSNFTPSPVADNSHLPKNLLPYFTQQADRNKGRVMFTDKGTKKTYYGTRDNTGKFNLNNFDVLTAKNDRPEDSAGDYVETPMYIQDAQEKQGNIKNLITPLGSFKTHIKPDIYGSPGLKLGNTQIAIHKTYPGEYQQRNKVLKDGNPNNNNMSWGCINGDCRDVQKLVNFNIPSDSMYVGDSRLDQKTNMKSINRNHAFGGPVEGDKPIKKRKVTLPGQLKVQITPAQPESLFSDQDGYAPLYQGNKAVGYPVRMNDVPGSVGLAMMDGSGIVPNSNRLTKGYFNQNDSQVRDNNPFLNGFGNPTPQFANGGRVQTNHAFNWDNNYQTGNETNGEQGFRSTLSAAPREQSNVEAERGETALADFDGDGQLEHMNIGGERHFNGGTPLQLPQGAFIFSDTRKMKLGGPILAEFGKSEKTKQKFTPAKLSKQYDINLFKQKLKNESDDKYATDTAELMIQNNQEHLGKLAYVQEAMKGFPNGMPQVAQQLMGEEQQQTPMARMGGSFGLPKAKAGLPIDLYGKANTLAGNITPTNQSNMYNKDGEYLNRWESIIPGISKMDNKFAQNKIYDYTLSTPEGMSKIKDMWKKYGLTNKGKELKGWNQWSNNGKFSDAQLDDHALGQLKYAYADGMFGARQLEPDQIRQKIPFNPPLNKIPGQIPGIINPNFTPNVPGIAPPQSENPGITPNTPAYTNGNPTSVGPNAFDVMNFVHAAGRPIDHIRPQLFRTNAQISNPTLLDNTAEIQQIQSNANTANQVVQNTANGQVARANSMGITGRLFDPINQSNGQTNNGNVQIMNQWNQQRDATMNNQQLQNQAALTQFVQQNDMYKANLSKEKQLKFTDTMTQGQNMINNNLTMASILEGTPNMTVKGPFWNPSFKPGVPGIDLLTGNTQGANARATPEQIITFMKQYGANWNEANEYLNGTNRTRKTYKRSNPQPDETQTTYTT